MTEAYRCDDCHEYFDGVPYATYDLCCHMRGQPNWNSAVVSRQVCDVCFREFCKKNDIPSNVALSLVNSVRSPGEIRR